MSVVADGVQNDERLRFSVSWILEPLVDLSREPAPYGYADEVFSVGLGEVVLRYRKLAKARNVAALAGARIGLLKLFAEMQPHVSQSVREQVVEDALHLEQELRAGGIEWKHAADIFAALPSTPWVSRDLQLGPGRPTLVAGYGASLKTMAAQALALAVASGSPVWGHFTVAQGAVRHLDYEQGFRATAKRYQRLAMGAHLSEQDVAGNLALAVFPELFLNSDKAVDAYARAVDGAKVVVLDAFRGAIPGADENDSGVRVYLDNLTRVSEKTGATFVVIHHAGKPKDGHDDARTVARGSSAIFDASGCVLLLSAKKKGAPRLVQQVKSPADAEAGAIEDFQLAVEDVPTEHAGVTGVRVTYQAVETAAKATADAVFEAHAQRVLDFVRDNPRCSKRVIRAKAGLNGSRADEVVAVLVEEGRLHELPGKNGGHTYAILGTV